MADEHDAQTPAPGTAANESETTIQGLTPALFFAIFSALLLIMLAGGFAVAYFILPQKIAEIMVKSPSASTAAEPEGKDKEHAPAEHKEEAKEAKSEEGHGKKDEVKEAIEKEAKAIAGQEFRVQDILVNISGTRGGRFVKASLYFEASTEVLGELETNRAKVTDLISQILSSQTLDSLTRSDARGRIRGELLTTVNAVLTKGKVENIYFTDFIIQ